ncbi:SARP family transcriptional regulator [Plantactinospora sp. BC1]|uniref:tetratricopeptide repeat protein n=1 Tax=Plantactinospora sp. BC1 TaxID=2108470 RepID=UPI000D17814B|nr:tetratricopeptide repeat protein [Plantactinospora sp. BC1]AVT30900.1 SARP family transcriptional regulator [Plantactinospora sp. BC1]
MAPETEFAALLRQHRLDRRLTQEELAEGSGISSRSVREMERGRGRSPRPRTVERLATALALTGTARDEFVLAGRLLFWANRPGQPRPGQPNTGQPRPDQPNPGQLNAGQPNPGQPSSGRSRIAAPIATAAPRQLPADLSDFVAREDEVGLLRRVLAPTSGAARLVVISGPSGVGKTALAVHAGHSLAGSFPDGQLYAALRDTQGQPVDPAEVLASLLRALGADGSALPTGLDARAGLFRTRLAGRRVLLLLDDAHGHRQVEPFLPPEGTAVMVTSRLSLTGLSGVTAIDLRPLPTAAAIDLLCRVSGGDRVRNEPATAEIVDACGGLPLAIRIAGARLAARPHWTAGMLGKRLADERHRLDELRHGDLAVRPGLQLAYQGLTPAAARAFALLGGLNVPTFPGWPVATLLDSSPDVGAAVLEELLDARLLDALGPDQAGQLRYRFHELTRLFARERQQDRISRAEWAGALERTVSGWLALARNAQDRLDCRRFHLDDRSHPAVDVDQRAVAVATGRPVEWFEAEREALAALVPASAEAGLAAVTRALAGCSADFYQLRGYYDDWRRGMLAALDCCRRVGDRPGEAVVLRGLGSCLVELDDPDAALSTLRAARGAAANLGDEAGAAMTGRDIGFVLGLTGRLAEAETELRAAVAALGRVGERRTRALTLTSLGFVLRQRGDTDEALRVIRDAIAIARSCRDRFLQACGLRGLAGALLAAGRDGEAEQPARKAAELFARIGDPIGTAQSLRAVGEALAHDASRAAEAQEALASAVVIFRDRGNDWGLALAELSLGEIEVRRAGADAVGRLRRSLRYWTDQQVPVLRARALVALAAAAESTGDPAARGLLMDAYRLYQELGVPESAELAERLGIDIPGRMR